MEKTERESREGISEAKRATTLSRGYFVAPLSEASIRSQTQQEAKVRRAGCGLVCALLLTGTGAKAAEPEGMEKVVPKSREELEAKIQEVPRPRLRGWATRSSPVTA